MKCSKRCATRSNTVKKPNMRAQEKTSQLVSTLESIPQIAFTMGVDGHIEYANSQWEKYARNGFPESHPDDPSR